MPRKKGSKNKFPLKKTEEKKQKTAYLNLTKKENIDFENCLITFREVTKNVRATPNNFLNWCYNYSKPFLDSEKIKLDKSKN